MNTEKADFKNVALKDDEKLKLKPIVEKHIDIKKESDELIKELSTAIKDNPFCRTHKFHLI